MSGVLYRGVWCMIQWCLVYDKIMFGVWCNLSGFWVYSEACGQRNGSLSDVETVSYTEHHCIIHHTALYHTPNLTVSYTRHHCIIHQTCLYRTPHITVSYTRHHFILRYQNFTASVLQKGRDLVAGGGFGEHDSLVWCMIPWYLVYGTVMSCMIQWYLVCDTVVSTIDPFATISGVSHSEGWCMIQWCLMNDTVVSGVWYSVVWYV